VPETCGDRDRLQQVVWNLLSNAIKFTPREGRVAVRVDTLGADVRIVVADNGQGIAPAFLPRIFDRFSQADSTVTRAHGGLGLGMSIVRHLVELHGGTVKAESEGEGRGATLTVTLPIRVYEKPSEPPPSADESERDVPFAELPRLDGVRVLVVDDEPNARQVASAILQQKGAAVAEAASAEKALELVASGRVDLIVSDLAMPVTDGYEMMRQMRQGSGRFVPAVALTAGVDPEDVTAAFAAGYQRHLPKPVSAAALVRTAAELAPCRRPSEASADTLT
jgi:CheY-like chemotaxis protein